jgi:hypothetical protein
VIEKLNRGADISTEDQVRLAYYVGTMIRRVPHARNKAYGMRLRSSRSGRIHSFCFTAWATDPAASGLGPQVTSLDLNGVETT